MNLTPREQAEVEAALGFGVEPVEPSPALKSNIMAKIAQTPQLPPAAAHRAETRWFSRRPVSLLAAAAAAILLFVGGTVVGVQISDSRQLDAESQSLAALTAASDLQSAKAEVAGGGEATLLWSLNQRKSAILVNDLPPLPGSETYQLWYIGDDGPIPAGTFESKVSATTWRVLDGAMSAGDTVGVTIEPAGGSSAPTTDPIVAIPSS